MALALAGNNKLAYLNRTSPEILLSGAAGTGKTYSNLLKLLWFCGEYPGARTLMIRKTRKSLAESAMVTLERILHSAGLLPRPIERTHRHEYKLPRGSTIVVGGMDDPSKVLSTEYDLIYVNEATELNVNEWEELSFRLRAMAGPFDQMLADCNPESPHHWLYKRFIAGREQCRVAPGLPASYPTTHYENPGYYDWRTRTWTEAGERYLKRLKAATGIRKARKYEGKWVSAEGVVYDYNPDVHTWPSSREIPRGWPRVWSVDWGKRVPTALGVWAVDAEGRMILTREVYRTHLRPDVLGRRVKTWIDEGKEPRPAAVVCDHDTDNEGYQTEFEKASGLSLALADKADRDKGIQAMQARFDVDPESGSPRVFFRSGTLDHEPDSSLVDSALPTCLIEELVGYIWDENQLKDEPIAHNDHHMDQMRYASRWVDSNYSAGKGADLLLANPAPKQPEWMRY
jgi:PBSX family phage terminase large subunit